MSAQLPPDPILTTYQYWNWLNVDEATRRQRALDNNYMMFPTVQNNPVSFSKMFVELITSLTQIASTFAIEDRIINLLYAINTWTGSNQFNSIKVNSLANITLNNANIGNITLNNSTFNDYLEPNYNYPITGGSIGQIYTGTLLTATVISNIQTNVMSMTDLPAGIYLFSASANVSAATVKTVFAWFDGVVITGTGEQCQYYPGGFDLHFFQSTGVSRVVSGAAIRWRMLVRNVGITLLNYRFQAIRIG
jgi:hypothetical protein